MKILPLAILVFCLISLLIFAIRYYRLKRKAAKPAHLASQEKEKDWSIDFLQEKRNHADVLADNTIELVMKRGDKKAVTDLFLHLTSNSELLPKDLPPELTHYFEQTSQLPEWANKDLLSYGHDFYVKHGLLIAMLLFYKSLPECYTGARGAEVLVLSSRLSDRDKSFETFSRRMAETGLFMYKVMMPGSFHTDGGAIRAAQKVRLIHATIRFFVKHNIPNWDVEHFGEPINQEDMAGTLMAFSACVIEGLEVLGVELTELELESFVHCWRVVGHIMGVSPDLIPVNAKDAHALGQTIIDHQKLKSKAGHKLTEALMEFCDAKAPSFISKNFHINMMRILMGNDLSDLLGIPKVSEGREILFLKSVKVYINIREFLDKFLIFSLPIYIIDRLLLKISITYLSKQKIKNFFLPKTLQTD